MAAKDKEGNWTFSEEEEAQIEMGARMRLRADDLREKRAAEKKAAEEEEQKKEKDKNKGKPPVGWS